MVAVDMKFLCMDTSFISSLNLPKFHSLTRCPLLYQHNIIVTNIPYSKKYYLKNKIYFRRIWNPQKQCFWPLLSPLDLSARKAQQPQLGSCEKSVNLKLQFSYFHLDGVIQTKTEILKRRRLKEKLETSVLMRITWDRGVSPKHLIFF